MRTTFLFLLIEGIANTEQGKMLNIYHYLLIFKAIQHADHLVCGDFIELQVL
jgi:hypothetical protein